MPRGGLLLRRVSAVLGAGERERRSNLDGRRGSGSVWSKRDRLRGSSAISSRVERVRLKGAAKTRRAKLFGSR